jgi:hypothetical protein
MERIREAAIEHLAHSKYFWEQLEERSYWVDRDEDVPVDIPLEDRSGSLSVFTFDHRFGDEGGPDSWTRVSVEIDTEMLDEAQRRRDVADELIGGYKKGV